MSTILDIAVGDRQGQLSLTQAARRVREATPGTTVRVLDRTSGDAGKNTALDPTLVVSYLSASVSEGSHLSFIVEAPTTHNPPYNLARRIQSLDRITGGRTSLELVAGGGDEVSDPVTPDPTLRDGLAEGPGPRRAEYVEILSALWKSFPRDALIADQESALFVDQSRIRPINHEGRYYRVAGPLDSPSISGETPRITSDSVSGPTPKVLP